MKHGLVGLIPALLLAACGTAPTSITQQPTSVRPVVPPVAAAPTSGAIYQTARHRPLFEDRRARQVGDLVTIFIEENTQASKEAASNGEKTGSSNSSISSITRLPLKALQGLGITASSENSFDDQSATSSGNKFSGSVTATVVEVLPNGNLVVSGEKQIALDKGTEYIRLSGVVQPDTLLAGNRVSSSQIADARMEYRTTTNFDRAELMNWLGRFFLSVIPL